MIYAVDFGESFDCLVLKVIVLLCLLTICVMFWI